MTNQTRHFIEISDIIGVEFKCRKCGVSLLIEGAPLLPP